ncbi:GNAT family N-acetyltransferase [Streptomyces sp. PKU-EA00015]|uniref:GNAT family N-acetyltransferase n=1 Tax=Streptomyces sp. PKU-EA00015 TaxID=2748326 RepID=UPI0035C87B29
MITATPRPATLSPRALRSPGLPAFSVRPARPDDAAGLAALSRPFVRSGALRERTQAQYACQARDFLVAEAADGTLEGCLGLSVHHTDTPAGRPATGVLYSFCVAGHRQGCGVGARLLHAALARARSQSLRALFTATTGSGRLFLRHGFAPACPSTAPAAWAQSLDPRRNARVLACAL